MQDKMSFFAHRYAGYFTLDTIARVAFGICINAQKEKKNEFHSIISAMFDTIMDVNNPMLVIFCT